MTEDLRDLIVRAHEAHQAGDLAGAERLFLAAFEQARVTGDEAAGTVAAMRLGAVRLDAGDLDAARGSYIHALARATELDEPLAEADICMGLGRVAEAGADDTAALGWFTRAVDGYAAVGHPVGEAYGRVALGGVTPGAEGYAELDRAEELFVLSGDEAGLATSLLAQAEKRLADGSLAVAESSFAVAGELFEQLDDERGMAAAADGLDRVRRHHPPSGPS